MEHVHVTMRTGITCPGLRDGNIMSWIEPGRADAGPDLRLPQRHYLLLDIGIKMAIPNVWIERGDPLWYVDLVIVEHHGTRFDVIDFDIDVFIPTDGRPYRTLDLDEFADAVAAGEFTIDQALNGLRRWQLFLDRHVHIFGPGKDVDHGWRDFPPKAIEQFRGLPDKAFDQAT
jgi:hypothetical protein